MLDDVCIREGSTRETAAAGDTYIHAQLWGAGLWGGCQEGQAGAPGPAEVAVCPQTEFPLLGAAAIKKDSADIRVLKLK